MIVSSMHFQYKNMITKQYIKVIVRGDDENDIIFINLPISQSPNLPISQSPNLSTTACNLKSDRYSDSPISHWRYK